MSKIIYPFAAIPNQVLRGGHGPVNVAVLAVLMSHGKSTASARTLADEIGCDRKSIFKAIAYWKEVGPKFGILITTTGDVGRPTVVEIEITTCTENGTGVSDTRTENGTGGVPKTEHPPVPKTEHIEEDSEKKITEEDTPLPPGGDPSAFVAPGKSGIVFDRFWELYPKKVGRLAVQRKWERMKPSSELIEKILAAVVAQAKMPRWRESNGRYVPNPLTWLNQGRWDDVLELETESIVTHSSDGETKPWDVPASEDTEAARRMLVSQARSAMAGGRGQDDFVVQLALKRGIPMEEIMQPVC